MSYYSSYGGGGHPRPRPSSAHPLVDTSQLTPATAFTYAALLLLGAYALIHYLDILPILPLRQLVWNALVYATPPSLVIALEGRSSVTTTNPDLSHTYAESRSFAAKSDAMRSMLGLSGDGILHGTVQRSRRFTGLSIFKSATSDNLPGLGNWDNSCYQNSILQGFAALPSLHAFLNRAARAVPGAASRTTNAALFQLIEDLNSAKNLGRKFWTPPVLKSMSSWQQQDAQEYYSKVVDALEKELSRGIVNMVNTKGLEATPEQEVGVAQQDGADESKADIKNPLEGMLAQRVGCLRCGYVEGLSLIPFNCLTVPLGNRPEYDLASCLDDYTGLEPIQGVECPHCTLLRQKEVLEKLIALDPTPPSETKIDRQNDSSIYENEKDGSKETFVTRLAAVNAALDDGDFSDATLSKKCSISRKQRVHTTKTRQAVIARPPQALVIHINRSLFDEYSGALSKNYAAVRFPKYLDLSRWSLGTGSGGIEKWSADPAQSMLEGHRVIPSHEKEAVPNMIYGLRAVVTHQGRHENGHYIAYRRSPQLAVDDATEAVERSWWRLSDENVFVTSEEAVLSQGGVFMLFYEQASAEERKEYFSSPTPVPAKEPNDAEVARDDMARHEEAPILPTLSSILDPSMSDPIFSLKSLNLDGEPSSMVPVRTTSLSPRKPAPAQAPRSPSPAPATSRAPITPLRTSSSRTSSTRTAEIAATSPLIPDRMASRNKGTTSTAPGSPSMPRMRTAGRSDGTASPFEKGGRGVVSAN